GAATSLSAQALGVLARALAARAEPLSLADRLADVLWLGRLLRLVRPLQLLKGPGGAGLLRALVDAWPRAPEEGGARRTIRAMIDAFPCDAVRVAVQAPLLRGEWGYLDLIRRPQRASTLDAALREAARRHGGETLVSRVDALREPPSAASPPADEASRTSSPSDDRPRGELFELLRKTDKRGPIEAQAQALRRLGQAPDEAFVALCRELVDHPHPRLRLAAYRQLRRHGSREDARAAARKLLDDPRPDVQRSALAALAHTRDADALPAIVGLLDHRHNGVRRAALAALRLYGADARDAVEALRRGARPDRRRALDDVLAALDEPER
ncbi:MAG: HEAT repeat domain-containing protein, partial [Nannocystaceae bacterium]